MSGNRFKQSLASGNPVSCPRCTANIHDCRCPPLPEPATVLYWVGMGTIFVSTLVILLVNLTP